MPPNTLTHPGPTLGPGKQLSYVFASHSHWHISGSILRLGQEAVLRLCHRYVRFCRCRPALHSRRQPLDRGGAAYTISSTTDRDCHRQLKRQRQHLRTLHNNSGARKAHGHVRGGADVQALGAQLEDPGRAPAGPDQLAAGPGPLRATGKKFRVNFASG